MAGITGIGKKIAEKAATTRGGMRTFHAAYKKAPAETLGSYAKTHKFGIGLTAAAFMPSPFHAKKNIQARRSTHQGIDQK